MNAKSYLMWGLLLIAVITSCFFVSCDFILPFTNNGLSTPEPTALPTSVPTAVPTPGPTAYSGPPRELDGNWVYSDGFIKTEYQFGTDMLSKLKYEPPEVYLWQDIFYIVDWNEDTDHILVRCTQPAAGSNYIENRDYYITYSMIDGNNALIDMQLDNYPGEATTGPYTR